MSDLDIKILNYAQLRESFPQVYEEFFSCLEIEEGDLIRPLDEALSIFDFLEKIASLVQNFLGNHPHFLILFEKSWGRYNHFNDKEHVYELCFIEKFLFPETRSCPIENNGSLDWDGLKSYHGLFESWIETIEKRHLACQKKIHEKFSGDMSPKNLPCPCSKCVEEVRDLIQAHTFNILEQEINRAVEELEGLSLDSDREEFIKVFQRISRNIDRKLSKVKPKLRRGPFNQLKDEVELRLQTFFEYESDKLVVYRKKLDDFVLRELQEKGLRRDLLDQSQKERFFKQRGRGIWRGDQFLKQEIQRLIQTVLALKRKDISAKILQDYLGQFWLYTEARGIKRKITYHMGPTNSGKTYHAIQELAKVKKGCYLAPLRLLATELYDTLNEMEVKTTLLTGEEVVEVNDATHYSSTIEMVKLQEVFEMCVIDEIQMINDPQRGWAWTRALVGVQAPEIHLCGDPSALALVKEICALCGDDLEVKEYHRMTDLKVLPHKVKVDELEKHDAVIVFSRRNALRFKVDLERLGYKVSIVYGRLSPEVRREQARKFDQGETDIIVSTDAISMGMNLPIKRVIFTTLSKFIDSTEIPISNSEIRQIAGRAGRYNRYPTGLVSTLERVEEGPERIREAMAEQSPQKDFAMVGPDLDIFAKVNNALKSNALPELGLSEFLRLFNTMQFEYPFFCVDLKEMIEITEMVEQVNRKENSLLDAEVFGFSCAPVNLGLPGHVQFFLSMVNRYVHVLSIPYNKIDHNSEDIDYLETSIKCLELYQWLARHFNNKNFDYDEYELLHNKGAAIEKLNALLSEKITLTCAVCGCKLPTKHQHFICDSCFKKRKLRRRRIRSGPRPPRGPGDRKESRGNNRSHSRHKKRRFSG